MQLISKKSEDLIPYENNARTHSEYQIEQIIDSINEYGFTNPILIDEKDMVIAGHGRLEAAKQMGMKEVPCIVLEGLTEAQKKAYIIADNKMALNAGWDEDLLKQELESLKELDFDLSLTGFDDDEIDNILGVDDNEIEIQEDEVPDIPEEPKAKLGDIYQLGKHRLMCGDSTNEEDVRKLMNGNVADLVVTDPPYNVAIQNSAGMTIQNDDLSSSEFYEFLVKAFQNVTDNLKEGGVFYIWYASKEHINFGKALQEANLQVREQLIWNKNTFILGRQDYQWKHEPCLYGWKEGAPHYFVDDRTQSTVIEDKGIEFKKMKKDELVQLLEDMTSDKISTTIINENKPSVNDLHPTMKPIRLISRLIKNSSVQKQIVLDLFGGSGSTLIACEQLNRCNYTMEYDPKYVDVIIERWENLTGEKAVLIK